MKPQPPARGSAQARNGGKNPRAARASHRTAGACFFTVALLTLALTTGCVGPVKSLFPPAAGDTPKSIHVISHGWHTGIAIQRVDFTNTAWPVLADFPRADYLEFGWGDAEYYPAERATIGMAIRALCWPTPSVMHVAAVRGDLAAAFPASEIIRVEVSPAGLARMKEFIERQFRLDETGRVIPVAPGLYGEGRFYAAHGKFHFPRTCNRWTAHALRSAGCPITPFFAVTAGNVMWQTRRFGQVIAPAPASDAATRNSGFRVQESRPWVVAPPGAWWLPASNATRSPVK